MFSTPPLNLSQFPNHNKFLKMSLKKPPKPHQKNCVSFHLCTETYVLTYFRSNRKKPTLSIVSFFDTKCMYFVLISYFPKSKLFFRTSAIHLVFLGEVLLMKHSYE